MANSSQETEEREVETVDSGDVAPLEKVLGEVAIDQQMENVVKTAIAQSLVFDWSPLGSESAIGHIENFLAEMIESESALTGLRAKGQYVALRYGGVKGPVILKAWFNTKAVTVNCLSLGPTGKSGAELKENSFPMGENGFPQKTRKRILALARAYIKSRGFSVPAPEAEA